MTEIGALKGRLAVGKPIVRHNLTIFPLLDATALAVADYLPFGLAQKAGHVRITEVSVSGSVPTLSVQTNGVSVLLLDGEELIGAKQNRIVNLTILAAAKTSVEIPVSCVERGRWSSASPEFRDSPQTMYPRGRAKKMMSVSAAMMRSGSYQADQGEVWEDVDMRMAELNAASPTSAMGHIFDQHRGSVDEYLKDVIWLGGQVGAAFAINGKAVGVEIFETHDIAREYLPKVIRSYALDAIAQGRMAAPAIAQAEDVSHLIAKICIADARQSPSIGIGTDVRINSPELAAAALLRDGSVIHLSGFLKSITDAGAEGAGRPGNGAGRTSSGRRGRTSPAGRGRQTRPEGPGAETYPLEIVRDHMLMRVSNGLALIDTGSPVSIGRGSPLLIRGREWEPSTANGFALDAASEHLGVEVNWLIGYDILRAHRMLLDWSGRVVHVGRARTRHIASRFPLEMVMGVPVITASHQGNPIRAVADSGAALSYAPRSAVAGLPKAGEFRDFYPGVGSFTTLTWSTRVRLGERDVDIRVGVLPDALQLLFGMLLGPEGWIIGSELFRDRKILIDYRWQHILDLTD